MAVKSKSKLYKIKIITLKILPIILALFYASTTILDYFGIDSVIINYISFGLIYLFIYISSFVFNFCKYHRVPLYYIFTINLISIYDVYIGIPLNNFKLLQLYIFITLVFLIIFVILYYKVHKIK